MKNILLIACLVVSMVFNAEAQNCWNPTGGTAYAGANVPSLTAGEKCIYTHTHSPAATPSPFTNTMWPTYAYSVGASCPASTTTVPVTCVTNAASALTSAAPGLPTVASCYTGATLTATTLTNQVATTCATTSYFCQATFTGVSGTTATGFTSGCQATHCTPSSTVLCSMVANTNQVLGCYVGVIPTIGTNTFVKTICAPVTQGSGQPAVSAAFCQNEWGYSAATGNTITGSCVTSCTVQAISLTGVQATTTGRTCSGTIFGNTSGSDASININMIAMILSSIMGLFVIHF